MNKHCCNKNKCSDRNYLCKSKLLKTKLACINDKSPFRPKSDSCDEKIYLNKYYGSFHKSLRHNVNDGSLVDYHDFQKMVCAIEHNDQPKLESLVLASPSTLVLRDPLASLSGVLTGFDQCSLCLPAPPILSSKGMAAEMVELYCMCLARDSEFSSYTTNSAINDVLATNYLNETSILQNFPDRPSALPFTVNTVFRGLTVGESIGPYLSQFLLFNIKMGSCYIEQKHKCHPVRSGTPSYTIEAGRNKTEMINIQNGQFITNYIGQANLVDRYIYSGRTLANAVYADPVYSFFTNAAIILNSLNAPKNPGFPVSNVTDSFVIGKGPVSILCALAEVAGLVMKHAWYWKWQVYRRLRPEAVSILVDNVKNGDVPNTEYCLSSCLLDNGVLTGSEVPAGYNTISEYNAYWNYSVMNNAFSNSYTLPQVYKEGSPAHPAYPSGHASIAGACCTILKMFYDGSKQWNTLDFSDTFVVPPNVSTIAEPEPTTFGASLHEYPGMDANNVTVETEINKLASNVAIGRLWSGVHYRADGTHGILMGEKVAISYMEDLLSTYVQNNLDGSVPEITFTKFDGTQCTVKPSLCRAKH
jgi:hypothetical protein